MSGSQTSATGAFHVVNGQIIDPNGNVFVAKGIDIGPQDMASVASSLATTFPGANFIRLAIPGGTYPDPSQFKSFVAQMTAKGVVVEIEDHPYPSPGTYTGSQLAAESSWYASIGAAFANNPYVWFGTMNEPNSGAYGAAEAAITTQEVATYNAIRGAGNNSMIMMELYGGGNPGTIGAGFGMTAPAYANMTNIAWDLHFYGWAANYSTDQATVTSALLGSTSGGYGIAAAQTITSADGKVPVIVGEFGDSTTGSSVDANGTQVINAVLNNGYGYAAWQWSGQGGPDAVLNNESGGSGSLTAFGKQVAAAMATGIVTPPVVQSTQSANNTTVTSTSGAIVDASGNKWTITAGGQVATNGIADTTTSGVIELAYVNGTIWQENSNKLWWGETKPNAAWAPNAGTATSPLPAPPPPPAQSANNTTVTSTSGAIIDASGNKWTITSGGQVATNATADTTTSGVIELAYVNGTIWQENSNKLWWGETKPNAAWAPNAGTATSPLPAPPPPPAQSANNATVTSTSGAIIDASGNKWTITSGGQVATNGTADTTTSGVIELAYVNGTIWQENSNKLWWGETKPNAAWAPAAGTATSPLPATPTSSPDHTMILAGSSTAILDAGSNKWTITAGGQVAVNGVADPTTSNVVELAYVNKVVWQENTSGLWYSKTTPTSPWSASTATSPLPSPITIASGTPSTTVSQSQVSVVATSGAHMLFISGSGNVINLSGGADTITDSGSGNTYILPTAGHGTDHFTSNILNAGATLDLKAALAATTWNGTTSTLSSYLKMSNSTTSGTLSISSSSNGTGVSIATIDGATNATLTSVLAHSIT